MIVDHRVLHEDFVPREIEHRNDELNHLSATLEPVLDGERPETAFMLGPTGAGKTCTAKYVLDQLTDQRPDIKTAYINCWQEFTRFRVHYRLLEEIDQARDVHRSTPKDQLFKLLQETDDPIVAVLDEIDQHEESETLYDLHRLPHVHLVLIANREEEMFAGFDDRVRSRLRAGTRVYFDRYGTEELVEILSERARQGLEPQVIDDDQIQSIAHTASGDARVGIGILHTAARIAAREGEERITDEIVETAEPQTRNKLRQQIIDDLTEHQRILYDVIEERGEVEPGELYDAYEEIVDDPNTRRTLRNYLSKMTHYDLIESKGDRKGRTYSLVNED
ncbi:ATPase AAA [Halostagnicola sp. A56]|uniref:Cdc6/Cdc18 family protein n=1 Tax=Halostagnicola sp. A56 TaxID=1495067 RepID=UPI00049F01C3|nr:Cdc6/Cdc18 family protein [Halostagnicola sp. A56]KDE58217.1 ATPase AAA [Halostagnicola sp. A56]